jgi:glutamine synthetase
MGTYKGVTHYTHWFQPLQEQLLKTRAFETSHDGSDPVEKFGGAQLVQQEPDASSFPNGGIRNTFSQRIHCLGSYISSVYFGTTLCIPTVLFRTRVKL